MTCLWSHHFIFAVMAAGIACVLLSPGYIHPVAEICGRIHCLLGDKTTASQDSTVSNAAILPCFQWQKRAERDTPRKQYDRHLKPVMYFYIDWPGAGCLLLNLQPVLNSAFWFSVGTFWEAVWTWELGRPNSHFDSLPYHPDQLEKTDLDFSFTLQHGFK